MQLPVISFVSVLRRLPWLPLSADALLSELTRHLFTANPHMKFRIGGKPCIFCQ
jgi:hypothetical protein